MNKNRPHLVEVVTQEDKMSLGQYLIRRPFSSYFKIGSITFGFCLLTNFMTAVLDPERQLLMLDFPIFFTGSLFSKSCFYGLLWPAFYLKLLTKPNRAIFLYGIASEW